MFIRTESDNGNDNDSGGDEDVNNREAPPMYIRTENDDVVVDNHKTDSIAVVSDYSGNNEKNDE